jgi:transglutaminase-like putative cysteine protease
MNEEERLEEYLAPAPGVTSEDPEVLSLARSIARGAQNDREAGVKLFNWVRDGIRYNPYSPFHEMKYYEAAATLRRREGYCVQKSSLLAALARAVGIPSRLVFADIRNHQLPEKLAGLLGSDIMTYHGYVEWFLGGRWLKVTPSFEQGLCEKKGFRLVVFDGTRDAVLHSHDLNNRLHITYLKNHGVRAGVPLEEIRSAWDHEYGKENVENWKRSFVA